ncbi:hypothetical protein I4U23_026235 [Adineta vaga]|nr:hypothetical protein I4U23_026235 [Adineta vaga]
MLKFVLILLIGFSNLPKTIPCVAEWNQCGGINYSGDTSCCDSLTCTELNPWYHQCLQGTTASTISTTTTTTSTTTANQGCNTVYSQCGGQNWGGATCCIDSACIVSNPYYSQCLPDTTTTTTTTTQSTTTTTQSTTTTTQSTATTTQSTTTTTQSTATTTQSTTTTTQSTTSSSSAANQNCVVMYQQCGGINYYGSTTCCDGSACNYLNDYYYQCLPNGNPTATPPSTTSSSAGSSSSSSSSSTQANNGNEQAGVTTRYWDCCKASCAWPGKASVSSPVQSCKKNGVDSIDANAVSVCDGGESSMCNNQQPWSVNSTFSFGYAAAHISNQGESDWCCACYLLTFTSGPVTGKKMMVQVTNTGGDLGNNHFDLQMPGGGLGLFDGCSRQFGITNIDLWGARYGGVSSIGQCENLPAVLRPGCYWRFQWFQNADNPSMTFKKVDCPHELTDNTQCIRS